MVATSMSLQWALVLCLLGVVYSQFEGDICKLNNGDSGTCKLITQCQAAIDAVIRGVLPQTCGFSDTTPIVCCAGGNNNGNKPTVPVVPDVGRVTDAPLVEKSPQGKYGRKAHQKCREYAAYANTTYISPTLSAGPPKTISRLECSFQYVPLIVGGTKAKAKEFPHSAAIGFDSDGSRVYHCGGALISENFVITAGHCKYSQALGDAKYVRVGDLNLVTTTDDAQPQEYDIAEFIRHPRYTPPSKYNDILLVRLAQNVKFNHYVRPLCLFTEDQPPTKSAIAIGWGNTQYAGNPSDDLLKVTLDFASHDDCYRLNEPNRRTLKNGIVKESQICAGGGSRAIAKDTCQGDSGGPLQIYNNDIQCMYYLVGITSFGKICGVTNAPAVYTRVSHYIDWIEATVWP